MHPWIHPILISYSDLVPFGIVCVYLYIDFAEALYEKLYSYTAFKALSAEWCYIKHI